MRKLDKIELILLSYILLCAMQFAFGTSSQLWQSFYFVREHLFLILILVYKDIGFSVLSMLLGYGIMFYKAELILYNVILAFLTDEQAAKLNSSYDIAMILTASLFLIIFVCKFFNQICLTFSHFKKWINL